MKKIIVTGGSGFIGSNLVKFLLKKKYFVINIDCLKYSANPYNTKNLNKQNLLYLFYGCLFSFVLILAIFFINDIPIKNFLIQYIFYPISLGNDRILGLNID